MWNKDVSKYDSNSDLARYGNKYSLFPKNGILPILKFSHSESKLLDVLYMHFNLQDDNIIYTTIKTLKKASTHKRAPALAPHAPRCEYRPSPLPAASTSQGPHSHSPAPPYRRSRLPRPCPTRHHRQPGSMFKP